VAPDLDGVNERIVAALQDGGDVVPSATKLRGRTVIRVAITNHRSRLADFDRLIEQVLACGARVLETCS
jgi:glutamate/tyrosine decarboxylase-like PLP-dependent enzyme